MNSKTYYRITIKFVMVFLVVLIPFMTVQGQHNEQTVKEAVSRVNRQLFDALIEKDIDKIASLYTTNGTLFPPTGETIKGSEAIRKYWEDSINSSSTLAVTTRDIEFELYGSDTAYESGSYQLEYLLPQDPDKHMSEGIYLIIWKRTGETWKLDVDMWN